MGVQQFMRGVPAGLAEELLVQRQDVRVFMRFAHDLAFVLAVDGLEPLHADFLVGRPRLAAAADAATRAAHDFDEQILALAGLDLRHQLVGAVQTVRYTDFHRYAFEE